MIPAMLSYTNDCGRTVSRAVNQTLDTHPPVHPSDSPRVVQNGVSRDWIWAANSE